MQKHVHKRAERVKDSDKLVRKQRTIPDQSLSLRTIIDRYTRGVSVDVKQRDPVYVDQDEFDLEQVSRMDFAAKAELGQELGSRVRKGAKALEQKERERLAKEAEANAKASEGKPGGAPGAGIVVP